MATTTKKPIVPLQFSVGSPSIVPKTQSSTPATILPNKTIPKSPTPSLATAPNVSLSSSGSPSAFNTPVKPQVTATAPKPITPSPALSAPRSPAPTAPAPATPTPPPTYDTSNGYLTEYGKSIGAKAVQPGDPNFKSEGTTQTAPKAAAPKKQAVPNINDTISKEEKTYQKLLSPSKDELTTQEELDNLITSAKQGYLNTENQTIPMQFITGQLSAIEKRALSLAEPLESKLARLQASRTASLEASKFALDRADKQQQAEIEANKPMTIGGNLVKLNPETGAYDTVYEGKSASQPASVQEYEYAKANGYEGSFTDYQDADANRKKIAAGAGGLTTSQQSAAFKLSDDYRAESKDFFTQKAAYNRILASAQDPSAAGDLALIFNYMKVLDPGSTVREGEFATAQNSGSIPEIIWAKYNKIQSGERLAPEQRADFVNRAGMLFKGAQQAQAQIDQTFTERANRYGVPTDLILGNTNANDQQKPASLDEYYKTNPADRPKVEKLIIENPNLSDEDILQILTGFSTAGNASDSIGNRPQRNNNPLNIKASEYTLKYPGVAGIDENPATDGGKFLKFNSPEAGFEAAKKLITSSTYAQLDVDAALKRWSGGGYGAEIIPEFKGRKIQNLTVAEIDKLIKKMAQREGYNA